MHNNCKPTSRTLTMMKMRKKIRKRARMKNRTEIVRKQMMSTVSPSVT